MATPKLYTIKLSESTILVPSLGMAVLHDHREIEESELFSQPATQPWVHCNAMFLDGCYTRGNDLMQMGYPTIYGDNCEYLWDDEDIRESCNMHK